jgi:hypothetical protein
MSLETSFSVDCFAILWVVVLTEAAFGTGRRSEIKSNAITLESNKRLKLILCIAWLQSYCYTSCTFLKAQVGVGDPELVSLSTGSRNKLNIFVALLLTVSKFDLVISLTLSAWTRHAPEFLRGTLLPVVTSFPVELQTKTYFVA